MVWVIGASGMLGTELSEQLRVQGIPSIGTDVDVSILDVEAMRDFVRSKSISIIVNCAAYTAVDKAEDEPEKAYELNATAVGNMAEVAAEIDVPMVHISTDYVFPGNVDKPLLETDTTGPMSVYGKTKLSGEILLQKRWPKYYIVRTAWLYGKHGKNFVFTILGLLANKSRIRVINDQYGAPTNAVDLSRALLAIIKDKKQRYGTYHFCNGGRTTWYDFAKTIKHYAQECTGVAYSCDIEPISAASYGAKAPRPMYSLLCTDKYSRIFGKPIPEWDFSLRGFIDCVDFGESYIARNGC